MNELVKKIAKNYPKIKVFEPSLLICHDLNVIFLNNKRIYKDPDHLSKYGSLYLDEIFIKFNFRI